MGVMHNVGTLGGKVLMFPKTRKHVKIMIFMYFFLKKKKFHILLPGKKSVGGRYSGLKMSSMEDKF